MISFSYHEELEKARNWRNTQTPEALKESRAMLEGLRSEYPHVLAIGHELILVLEKLGELDQATQELQELERVFPKLDEETLSRGGKIHKVLAATATGGQAVDHLKKSEEYYRRAGEGGGSYPRINALTVRLLRAAKLAELGHVPDAQKVLRDVQKDALEFLNTEGWEQLKSDDNVWLPATQGEAAFLAGNYVVAEASYGRARAAANGKVFYLHAMRDQLKALCDAFKKLNLPVSGPLADPDTFFAISDTAPAA
jgi:hypothetical protein